MGLTALGGNRTLASHEYSVLVESLNREGNQLLGGTVLNSIGRASAVIVLVGGALLANATDAKAATSIRPCTNEEASSTCWFGTVSGYYDTWEERWYCPSSYTCMWDDEEDEPAGWVNFESQEDPCIEQVPCF